ncbi:hypothetical protein [Thermomonospora catenispora]|uniref:hypothetical protein n=1 Tax=Thermomonospora catenispora TaxID=2493090 RepID=UPI0011236847|nr:hypothetical protein [Thermomonospora catenispora]TNY36296.1 hypothetical protein EIO00_14540 [Thermomonospora catenispora]
MTAPLPFRVLRATVFATVCTGLGVMAHLTGAAAPPPSSVLAGLIVSLAAALPVLGRERSVNVLLPLLAALQVVLHLLFALSAPPAPAVPEAVAPPAGHAHGPLPADAVMVVLHGCAVTLTALWLSWGEALLWSALHRLALRFVRIVLAWALPEPVPREAPAFAEPLPPLQAVLRHAVSRRGPPRPL